MNHRVAFSNCNILDVEVGTPIRDCSIIISGKFINEIIFSALPESSDIQTIDMNGMWVIPGIVDLHVHLCDEPRPDLSLSFEYSESELICGLRASNNLSEAVRSGITTVRDVGSYNARGIVLKQALEQGVFVGPNVYSCGHLITYPGGHYCERGIEVRGIEQIRRAIKLNADIGADFIKVMNDPEDVEAQGKIPNPSLSHEEFLFLVQQAHLNNLKVACHTFPSIEGINNALDAGVDTFEHATPLDESILERFLEQDSIIVPTFVAAYDEFTIDYISERMNIDVKRAEKYANTNYPKDSVPIFRPDGVPQSIVIWLDRLLTSLTSAIKNNLNIGIGSDAGCAGTNFRSAIREMFLLTQLGASNLEVIQYATLVAAKALDESKIGKAAPGFLANLVFLEENPIENLDTLLNVQAVVINGKLINH